MEHEHTSSVAAPPAFVGNDAFQDILERRLASKLAMRPKRIEAPVPERAPEPEPPRAEPQAPPVLVVRRILPQRGVRTPSRRRTAHSRSYRISSLRVAVCAVRDNSIARDRIFLKLIASK
jgi:hypothetical protein